jgi:hypothetical protein
MLYGKFLTIGAAALGVLAVAPAAFAEDTIVITPGYANDKAVIYQTAAPTRMFNVEKAVTLAQGEKRFGANLQVGGLGTGGGIGLAGGVNIRADMNVQPGLEAGISATGLGGAGASNLLGDLNLRGKLALGEFSIGMMPVRMAGMANLGAMAAGGGIASGAVGVGVPLTGAITDNLNVTVAPGIALGFGGQNLGTSAASSGLGLVPALGLGLDLGLTRNLSAIVDGNLNYSGGFGAQGNLGLRYGITDSLAADLFVGYNGNPLTSVNAGTLGLGGYYAF